MKSEDKRLHRIKADYGTADYYRFYKNKNKKEAVSRAIYGEIVREFNDHVRDRISSKGAEYIMPFRLGKIELRKLKTEVKLDEKGNIINMLPVNWKETRELWAENPQAKEKGIKIRFTNEHTEGYTFRIFYKKSKANYKNKSIYKLKFNRGMKRNLSKSIFQGRIDAFLK